jgi:hypothetical protein
MDNDYTEFYALSADVLIKEPKGWLPLPLYRSEDHGVFLSYADAVEHGKRIKADNIIITKNTVSKRMIDELEKEGLIRRIEVAA